MPHVVRAHGLQRGQLRRGLRVQLLGQLEVGQRHRDGPEQSLSLRGDPDLFKIGQESDFDAI